ncbi:MAG TPA: glycosyltransferase [Burkholderiales bacterium]|nr:glycosyltransferase [Burkholderiales bacterium]
MFDKLLRLARFARSHGPRAALQVCINAFDRLLHPPAPVPQGALDPWGTAPPPSQAAPLASLLHLLAPPGPLPATQLIIGVILPVRDRAAMLAQAIASVQAQTYAHWRLYVVDDASSEAVALSPGGGAADPRIRLLATPGHVGNAAARNLGLAACAADGVEVVAYLDSDNLYYPDYLAEVARAYAAAPALRCAYCAVLWDVPGAAQQRFDAFDAQALREMRMLLDMNAFSHRPALAAQAGGFDPAMARHADWDFILRCTALAVPAPLPVLGMHYRAGDWPRVSNLLPSGPYAYRSLEKQAPKIGAGRRVLLLTHDYPQRSESYIDCEVRWLCARGFEVRVFRQEPGASPGVPMVPVYSGSIEEALDDFRPQAAHAHWFNVAAQYEPLLAARGILLTARGHSFDLDAPRVAGLLRSPALARLFLFPQYAGHWPREPKIAAMGSCFDPLRFGLQTPKPAAPRVVLRTAACLPTKNMELFFRVAARCPQFRFRLALARIGAFPDLPRQFGELNASLGNPVDLLFDVPHAQISEMACEASVYLFTTDLTRQVGMPVSIPEAMACGAVSLVPDAPPLRALGGPGLAYANEDQAVARLHEMALWDAAQWTARAAACINHAFANYADSVVLAPLGAALAGGMAEKPAPAMPAAPLPARLAGPMDEQLSTADAA